MPEAEPSPPRCPSCGASLTGPGSRGWGEEDDAARAGGILGGVPGRKDVEASARPGAGVGPLRAAFPGGPRRCSQCRDSLFDVAGKIVPHRVAALILPMSVAATRLRNHLRRLAILRPGRIEGDCYLLPFYRMAGSTPEGDDSFTVLAVSLGEERLESPFLPPADLKPFEMPAEGAAGASGRGNAELRVLPPTLTPQEAAARVEPIGWRAERVVELLHYPFWLMRVEDSGKVEGVWVDGIEVKLIHHRMRLAPPMPGRGPSLIGAALPALASLGVAAVLPQIAIPAAAAAWLAGVPLIHLLVLRGWRG